MGGFVELDGVVNIRFIYGCSNALCDLAVMSGEPNFVIFTVWICHALCM